MAYTRKSNQITSYDTGPQADVAPNAGTPSSPFGGGRKYLNALRVSVAVAAADVTTTATTIAMARLRTTDPFPAKIRLLADVQMDTSSAAGLRWGIGAAYSDAPSLGVLDGTPVSLAGTLVTSLNDLTGTSSLMTSATFGNVGVLDVTVTTKNSLITSSLGLATTYGQPLWQALGLAADPGGNFDLVLKIFAVATSTFSASSQVAMILDF